MPTRKEILEGLLEESEALRSTVGENTEANEALRQELDHLQDDISKAARDLATTTERAVDQFSDRISDLRNELAQTFTDGAKQMRNAILKGSVVGGVINYALQLRLKQIDSPQNVMANRVANALVIINNSYDAGERNDYNETMRLLRVYEFKSEQARYIVDQLIKHGVLAEFKDKSSKKYLMIDFENETWKAMVEEYEKGRLVSL
jgi:regulator of replication initiation timing